MQSLSYRLRQWVAVLDARHGFAAYQQHPTSRRPRPDRTPTNHRCTPGISTRPFGGINPKVRRRSAICNRCGRIGAQNAGVRKPARGHTGPRFSSSNWANVGQLKRLDCRFRRYKLSRRPQWQLIPSRSAVSILAYASIFHASERVNCCTGASHRSATSKPETKRKATSAASRATSLDPDTHRNLRTALVRLRNLPC